MQSSAPFRRRPCLRRSTYARFHPVRQLHGRGPLADASEDGPRGEHLAFTKKVYRHASTALDKQLAVRLSALSAARPESNHRSRARLHAAPCPIVVVHQSMFCMRGAAHTPSVCRDNMRMHLAAACPLASGRCASRFSAAGDATKLLAASSAYSATKRLKISHHKINSS